MRHGNRRCASGEEASGRRRGRGKRRGGGRDQQTYLQPPLAPITCYISLRALLSCFPSTCPPVSKRPRDLFPSPADPSFPLAGLLTTPLLSCFPSTTHLRSNGASECVERRERCRQGQINWPGPQTLQTDSVKGKLFIVGRTRVHFPSGTCKCMKVGLASCQRLRNSFV